MAKLKRSLKDAVRKLAYNTSVDQLKKRGVRQVNVLGIDRVVSLIEAAVHRTLKHRLLASDREEIADATKEEFLRLLKSNEDLRRTRDELQARQEHMDEEASSLRLEIQGLQQELETRLLEAERDQHARYEGENAAIVERVKIIVGEMGSKAGFDQNLTQSRVLALVMELIDRERKTAVAAEEAARDREVDLLQRRISKLNGSLQTTEGRLAQLANTKDVEMGIASIYREVQGLDGADRQLEKKRELMRSIFEANLRLQRSGV